VTAMTDLLALGRGLVADLFRRNGPLRRSPRRLRGGLVRVTTASLAVVTDAEGRARAVRSIRHAGGRAGTGAMRSLRRSAPGFLAASRLPRLPDAASRGLAGLARSVLALPGGPVPVAIAGLAMLAVAGYAWSQPLHTDRVQMRPFVVEYAFDYATRLPPNLVYEQRTLGFGDPIFLSVVDTVELTVAWSVPRGDVTVSGGQLAITTLLRSDAGWTRVIERVPVVEVDGLRAASTVRLDFPEALELARTVDAATGVVRPVRLEVLVETLLDDPVTTGVQGGAAVDGYSSATLSFVLDDRVIRLSEVPVAAPRESDPLAGITSGTAAASSETGGASSESGGASSETGRTSTETGGASRFSQADPGSSVVGGRVGVREVVQLFATDVLEANHLRIGPLRLEVATARRNLTLLGLALLGSGILGLRVLRRIESYGEAAVIEARYGPMLTPLPTGVNGHGAQAIDVGSFDALHALALDRDTPIMVDRRHADGLVAHYLFDGPTTYRYLAAGRSLSHDDRELGVDIPLEVELVDGFATGSGGEPAAP